MNVSAGQLIASTVVIPNSGTISPTISTAGLQPVGIYIPASFTGTALTFLACHTLGGTYVPVKDKSGAAVSFTVAPSEYLALDPTLFAGIEFLQIVSGTTETGARSLTVMMKGLQ